LRQLAEHHQLRQRRHAAATPDAPRVLVAEGVDALPWPTSTAPATISND